MAKKKGSQDTGSSSGKGSKELKIITIQAVTRDKVTSNPRQMGLLYVIDKLGPIHERTLQQIVHEIQQEGAGLGYSFSQIGGAPYSPELKSDLVALMYVGFVETEPRIFRRLRSTGDGKEALEKHPPPRSVTEALEKDFENLRNKASLLDSQINLEIRKKMEGMRRPRRRLY